MEYNAFNLYPPPSLTINSIVNDKNNAYLVPETIKKVLEDIYLLVNRQISSQITDATMWKVSDIAACFQLP